ncbi:hypothetical protein Pmani_023349 [Petrolisthes manimaculis]|uniref:Uncharacterized protein n=1 Tax=Petrolisthes manimaculis TaxID=1843537 RepID=A0AAE1NS49_9EUCA|nr:hypothetical protein Pmani_033167 [Petrolisthes manimaculis]KAK4304719.1 hypothetical protein Pmani_023349 [Petrolisthes manimaculis]
MNVGYIPTFGKLSLHLASTLPYPLAANCELKLTHRVSDYSVQRMRSTGSTAQLRRVRKTPEPNCFSITSDDSTLER